MISDSLSKSLTSSFFTSGSTEIYKESWLKNHIPITKTKAQPTSVNKVDPNGVELHAFLLGLLQDLGGLLGEGQGGRTGKAEGRVENLLQDPAPEGTNRVAEKSSQADSSQARGAIFLIQQLVVTLLINKIQF